MELGGFCLLYYTLLDANVGINHLHDMVAFMGLHVQLIYIIGSVSEKMKSGYIYKKL